MSCRQGAKRSCRAHVPRHPHWSPAPDVPPAGSAATLPRPGPTPTTLAPAPHVLPAGSEAIPPPLTQAREIESRGPRPIPAGPQPAGSLRSLPVPMASRTRAERPGPEAPDPHTETSTPTATRTPLANGSPTHKAEPPEGQGPARAPPTPLTLTAHPRDADAPGRSSMGPARQSRGSPSWNTLHAPGRLRRPGPDALRGHPATRRSRALRSCAHAPSLRSRGSPARRFEPRALRAAPDASPPGPSTPYPHARRARATTPSTRPITDPPP